MRLFLGVAVVLAVTGCGASDEERPPAASAAGPGLTVSEALESNDEGPLLVRGSLYARGGETRLCEALAESYPPQCGGASIPVRGLTVSEVEGVQSAEGVSWTEMEIKVLGEIEDGTLVVSDTAQA